MFERFARDTKQDVAAVLNDLVGNGLVYSTGRGEGAVYGLANESDRHAVSAHEGQDSLVHGLWLAITTGEP